MPSLFARRYSDDVFTSSVRHGIDLPDGTSERRKVENDYPNTTGQAAESRKYMAVHGQPFDVWVKPQCKVSILSQAISSVKG